MTFITAVLISIFWLLIAAILGGLIVYFMLRNRVRVLESELKTLQKSYGTLKDNCESRQKELDLEIRARDRKLEIAQGDFGNLQAKLEEKDRALQVEVAGRMEVQNNFNNLTDEYHKLKMSAGAIGSNAQDLDELREELAMESTRRADIEANYNHLKSECEAAQNSLKRQLQEKIAEMSLLQSNVNTVVATPEKTKTTATKKAKNSEDKKNETLDKIREKAKSFDYSRIGVANIDDKDDLKIIVGIGPFIEEKLHALSIYTFEQISKFTDEDVSQVTEAIAFFPGRIQRDHWISQAAELWEKKK